MRNFFFFLSLIGHRNYDGKRVGVGLAWRIARAMKRKGEPDA